VRDKAIAELYASSKPSTARTCRPTRTRSRRTQPAAEGQARSGRGAGNEAKLEQVLPHYLEQEKAFDKLARTAMPAA